MSQYYYQKKLPNLAYQYESGVYSVDNNKLDELYKNAIEYNEYLMNFPFPFVHSDEQMEYYLSQLLLENETIMATIEINKINLKLPIYHTCSNEVLQVGVGHLEYSTLPIGGEGTHCVLLGHTALSSARLFTDINKLVVGDEILIRVLDHELIYEVISSVIIEPDELDFLIPESGYDFLSLITCTPYGVGSHRLIVKAQRIK